MLKEVLVDALILGVGVTVVCVGVRGKEFFFGPLQGSVRGPKAPRWIGRVMFVLIGLMLLAFDLAHIFFGFATLQ